MARAAGGRPIGEVLDGLKADFPDISVSKIRFLEAQGLISPQRTPAGYRQFTDEDVALLRWILLQQRDHYLPLKVIRRRLKEGDGPQPGDGAVPGPGAAPESAGLGAEPEETSAWYLEDDEGDAEAVDDFPDAPAEVPPATSPPAPRGLWDGPAGRAYSRVEICVETGLDESALAELESYGLLRNGGLDDEALTVARLAAGFFAYGVEARHLRMYRTFAEREAAFLEQVVAPMVNARQGETKERAREALAELARLGQALHLSMLRSALLPTYGE